MGKRPSLAETMRQVAVAPSEQTPISAPALAVVPPPVSVPEASIEAQTAKPYFAATRVGKKKVTLGLSPTAHKQLKSLALEQDRTAEVLMVEAIRDLFAKYGKPIID